MKNNPSAVSTAPSVRAVQFLTGLVGTCMYLATMTSISIWKAGSWEAWQIGVGVTVFNLFYVCLVFRCGRLADSWGRVRTAILGSLLGAAGCLAAALAPRPGVALAAGMVVFGASALCFPSLAGIMSGLESGTRPVPLHAKVSNYNMGWSLGSLAGFGLFGALASLPRQAGYFLAAAAFTLVALMLRPRLGFAARLPAASGDRSSLPELPRLTFMSRFNLLLTCVMAVALVSQLEKSFGTDLELDRARRLTGICLTCYSAGFVVMFFVLGRWSGWVLRPWRLLACQSGLLLGATAFALLSFLHGTHGMHGISAAGLAACGLIIGLGYGASYTGSLYYSLRLPAGASSSAGIHETYIGAGNTVGPTLAGLFLQLWGSRGGWPQAGLGLYMLAFALIGLLFQLALIPGIVRLTKRAS